MSNTTSATLVIGVRNEAGDFLLVTIERSVDAFLQQLRTMSGRCYGDDLADSIIVQSSADPLELLLANSRDKWLENMIATATDVVDDTPGSTRLIWHERFIDSEPSGRNIGYSWNSDDVNFEVATLPVEVTTMAQIERLLEKLRMTLIPSFIYYPREAKNKGIFRWMDEGKYVVSYDTVAFGRVHVKVLKRVSTISVGTSLGWHTIEVMAACKPEEMEFVGKYWGRGYKRRFDCDYLYIGPYMDSLREDPSAFDTSPKVFYGDPKTFSSLPAIMPEVGPISITPISRRMSTENESTVETEIQEQASQWFLFPGSVESRRLSPIILQTQTCTAQQLHDALTKSINEVRTELNLDEATSGVDVVLHVMNLTEDDINGDDQPATNEMRNLFFWMDTPLGYDYCFVTDANHLFGDDWTHCPKFKFTHSSKPEVIDVHGEE